MTSELSSFAARLRGRFLSAERETRNAKPRGSQTVTPDVSVRSDVSDAVFGELALELFALQFHGNSVYRRVCETRQASPGTVLHWREIPAVPTAAFKEFEVTCLSAGDRTDVFHSSGTTEQRPSRHFHCAESLAVYEASLWPWFVQHVLACHPAAVTGSQWPIADGHGPIPGRATGATEAVSAFGDWRLAILTPPPAQASNSSLVHMFETVRRRLGAEASAFSGRLAGDGGWGLDLPETLARLREGSQSDVPLVVLGTAFSFVHLLDSLAEQNLRFKLPLGSRVMETGGYKGRSRSLPKAALHAFITERLGIPPSHIVSEYGMSELSSQAYDWVTGDKTSSRHFHFPPWARVQVISPETGCEVAEGETGLLRVFDLANVWSVMTIQTEDLAVRRGDGFELVGRAPLAEPRGCSLMPA